MRQRATGIIIKDNKVLLIRRIKGGKEYYVFPGGGVEAGESAEDALTREIKEETNLEVREHKFLFKISDEISDGVYFLVEEFSGTPSLGGPEKEHMNAQNQYYLEWQDAEYMPAMQNLLPRVAVEKLMEILNFPQKRAL